MLLALSILLSILESFLPIIGGHIPGMKLGLANSVTIMTLFLYGPKEAFSLSILRVILMGMLRTGIFSINFFFSCSGALFSISAMTIFKNSTLSIVGVSIIGSIFHSVGQIVMAILFLKLPMLIYYLPWMILFSMVTGTIIGFFAKQMIERVEKINTN